MCIFQQYKYLFVKYDYYTYNINEMGTCMSIRLTQKNNHKISNIYNKIFLINNCILNQD